MTLFSDELAERKRRIRKALKQCEGNVRAAARVLCLSRSGLYKMLDQYKIDADSYRSTDWNKNKRRREA